jgi:tRNA(Ile)-lysidine synthase TilS/MesJ
MRYICGPDWDKRVVDLNPKPNCAIVVSGGIDSLVLFHLLKDLCNLDVFNIHRKDGFDNYKRVEQLVEKQVYVVDELTTNTKDRVSTSIKHINSTYNYDEIYTAINLMPPIEYFPEFDRLDRPARPWRLKENHNFRAPFLHLYKYHILSLSRENNIDISDTKSCIASLEDECGACIQCLEKKWAYEQL